MWSIDYDPPPLRNDDGKEKVSVDLLLKPSEDDLKCWPHWYSIHLTMLQMSSSVKIFVCYSLPSPVVIVIVVLVIQLIFSWTFIFSVMSFASECLLQWMEFLPWYHVLETSTGNHLVSRLLTIHTCLFLTSGMRSYLSISNSHQYVAQFPLDYYKMRTWCGIMVFLVICLYATNANFI